MLSQTINNAVHAALDLHLICDNYVSDPRGQEVATAPYAVSRTLHPHQQLLAQPRRTLFAELANRKLRRSAYRRVVDLERDIRTGINEWNMVSKPLIWTKTVDDIIDTLTAYYLRISDSGH